MPYYLAIVEDASTEKAVGVWFPDLPGCFSAGDDVDEALRNAGEALVLYADALARDGRSLPPPRAISDLRNDPQVQPDLRDHLAALVEMPVRPAHAAE
jgi:predicted RNase H-like HicB family nuclease